MSDVGEVWMRARARCAGLVALAALGAACSAGGDGSGTGLLHYDQDNADAKRIGAAGKVSPAANSARTEPPPDRSGPGHPAPSCVRE